MLEKLYIGILLVVFGGIVLHAPLSVGFGTLWPDYVLLIKSWKEILILIAAVLVLVILRRKKETAILKEPLLIGIGIYLGLHLVSILLFDGSAASVAAGLAIDVRYIVFFALVFIAMRLYPRYKKVFIRVGIVGALVVVIFAILQVFVLPADILKYIGYSVSTIMPYLTVDQNQDFIRINSTLRGPNPLGAYAVIVLSVLAACWLRVMHHNFKRPMLPVTILLIGGVVALWASYSRSALIAAVIAIAIVLAVTVVPKLSKRVLVASAVVILGLVTVVALTINTPFVSTVILHEDPAESGAVNSNDGHIESLQDGLMRMLVQPFGAGVGSTGSASLYTEIPLIIENQYLFIAHEVGWLGLAFFLLIFVGVMSRLWHRRSHWLPLGVFASGVGLAFIGLLLPVWVDDTVAIVWWGLAAVALGARND
jgi:hypothetical protein